MKLETLHDLYVDELKDLYNAEHQLLKALPKMAKAASSPQLARAFTDHLAETKGQVDRLEKVFKELDASPKGKTCKAMEGLLEEGKEVMDEEADPSVMDAALIAAAQRVEHYEMEGTDAYGRSLVCSATNNQLGYCRLPWMRKEPLIRN
jgi:ferritin-like metal-binding protein YciE